MAEGDRVLAREEVVELADAVAESSGIASGIGTTSYGAQLVVDAADSVQAVERASAVFTRGPRHERACRHGRSAEPRRSASTTTWTTRDPAGFVGRIPVRRPARARRLDPSNASRGLRHRLQARPRDQARPLRGHLRRPRRRPRRRAISVQSSACRVLGCVEPAAGSRSTSAPTRCPAGCARIACRSHAS